MGQTELRAHSEEDVLYTESWSGQSRVTDSSKKGINVRSLNVRLQEGLRVEKRSNYEITRTIFFA